MWLNFPRPECALGRLINRLSQHVVFFGLFVGYNEYMAISALNAQDYQQNTAKEAGQRSKTNLLFFFLVLGLAIIEDLVDLASHGLSAVGMGLTATGLGAIIGIPVLAISWIVSFLFGLFINFIIAAYFFSTGQGVSRRLAVQSIGFIIELVPFISMLPLTTATFVIAHFIGKVPNPVVKVAQLARVGR